MGLAAVVPAAACCSHAVVPALPPARMPILSVAASRRLQATETATKSGHERVCESAMAFQELSGESPALSEL
eukprot:9872465-Alexandrium_andersonii.AAC.1